MLPTESLGWLNPREGLLTSICVAHFDPVLETLPSCSGSERTRIAVLAFALTYLHLNKQQVEPRIMESLRQGAADFTTWMPIAFAPSMDIRKFDRQFSRDHS
jgi:hypothetical protein